MVLDDQLCSITTVSDLYTISFDGVDVRTPGCLGMEAFFQAHKHQKK